MISIRFRSLFCAATMLLLTVACSPDARFDGNTIAALDIVNLKQPENNIVASGQPTEEQFRQLADSGVRHVINLRAPQEMDWDEAALVSSLDMMYHSIPISGGGDITRDNAQQLYDLLAELEGEPVIVHCASGNRVGALMAVASAENQGLDADSAVTEGQRWGLTQRMEPAVRQTLADN